MTKLINIRNWIKSKNINYRAKLLCKIFLVWLLLQFYVQTFVTYKLGRDGKIWSFFWMWKEFVLLLFVVLLWRYFLSNVWKWWIWLSRKNIKTSFIFKFILLFTITLAVFAILSVLIQKVWLWAFILSFKYDLLWFFIFGIWVCLALAYFTEKDKDILIIYKNLIKYSVSIWMIRWLLLYLWVMSSLLSKVWFNKNLYEWTVGQNPPAAYYTNITPREWDSYVRNNYLFERPTTFGFWLIAFFPVFMLWFLRKKSRKYQLSYTILFGLLIFSTRSRAGIVVLAIEAFVIFFILYWNFIKKYLIPIVFCSIAWFWWLCYLGRWILVREHSNTGHLFLMKSWRRLASQNIITWRWAWYSWPASHQLCYDWNPIYEEMTPEDISLDNKRCETLRKINLSTKITTYWFNPENQYLQILMEYGLVGTICWLLLCLIIVRYSGKTVLKYRYKNKSSYQSLLYFCLIGFTIWFIGLWAEGLVLHSLVDRMVIYPFFMLYWITIWLWEKEKDCEYIEPVKVKKKKKSAQKKKK